MLMGEYNYYQNFLHSGAVAKLLFVLFLLDMSVVLMNLVLGLAVSDIEQLQKNSGKFDEFTQPRSHIFDHTFLTLEVRRLKMETCGVLHTENLYKTLAKLLKPIW